MIKKISLAILLIVFCSVSYAQKKMEVEILKLKLASTNKDSNRVVILNELCTSYRGFDTDSSKIYGQQALNLAQQISFKSGEVRALVKLGITIYLMGDIPEALKLIFRGLQIAEENHYRYETAKCLDALGNIYGRGLNDNQEALDYYKRARLTWQTTNPNKDDIQLKRTIDMNTGIAYLHINQYDSALVHLNQAYKIVNSSGVQGDVVMMFLGELHFKMGRHQLAMEYLQKSISSFIQRDQFRGTSEAYNIYAGFFREMNQIDSAIYYAGKGMAEAQIIGYKQEMLTSCNFLAEVFQLIDIAEANKYLKMAKAVNEELYGAVRVQSLQKLISEEQERERKAEMENIAIQNRIQRLWIFSISGALISLLILLFILYRNNKNKQKANVILKKQKEEIQDTLTQLKSTQSQLIQSEKMASLGELTAGIAHEIQNPLNFVNNFSEVNSELITELKEEIEKGDKEEALAITNDIDGNEQKINHHGKRAEAIVKGMLQHSRTSSGQKEPTDINKLANEYLRLSYHGLRAKDKSFNADFKMDLDETLPKINVIPQDIGRVLLNLINNAFYAVSSKTLATVDQGYKPEVVVSTFSFKSPSGDLGVKITVKDNGLGIPQKIKYKIFQPFFTTKPTGSGTGLGLSLSYDIIKAHDGELKVESKENVYTEFILILPI